MTEWRWTKMDRMFDVNQQRREKYIFGSFANLKIISPHQLGYAFHYDANDKKRQTTTNTLEIRRLQFSDGMIKNRLIDCAK
jgi:hypothetical protein